MIDSIHFDDSRDSLSKFIAQFFECIFVVNQVALAVFYAMGQDARQYVKPVHQFFGGALVLMGAFAIATGTFSFQ